MDRNYSYYFLRETAISVWKDGDTDTQNKMLVNLIKLHKENWFKRVIYTKGFIAVWKLREFAEDAFEMAWEKFNERGKAGTLIIKNSQYLNLFYGIFRHTFLKLLEQEKKYLIAEQVYFKNEMWENEHADYLEEAENIFVHVQNVLNKMNTNCAELIQWRYKQRLSFDEIALRKKIKRKSCIKILSRCKKSFMEIYKNNKT